MVETSSDTKTPTKSARTRKRILDAAAAEFRQAGYNARLVDIAERAGMQAGSLYYHFASREELVAEILQLGIATAFAQVRRAIEELDGSDIESDPRRRLETAIRAHTMAVLEQSDYASAQAKIVGQVPPDIAEAHKADQRSYGTYWNDLLETAATAGVLRADLDLFAARMLAFGAMNWTTEWFDPSRRLSADQIADTAVMMIMSGLAK